MRKSNDGTKTIVADKTVIWFKPDVAKKIISHAVHNLKTFETISKDETAVQPQQLRFQISREQKAKNGLQDLEAYWQAPSNQDLKGQFSSIPKLLAPPLKIL
jgi:hypothetical protein